MKCPWCNSKLLSLYHREGTDPKRKWIKIDYLYCKTCKKPVETPKE